MIDSELIRRYTLLFYFFSARIFLMLDKIWGDDREAEGNALLMRRMATPYRGFESLSLRNLLVKERCKGPSFLLFYKTHKHTNLG